MRFNELIVEAETGTENAKQIHRQFTSAGYKKLGSGVDSTVYAKNESNVVKILMPDDITNQAENVFNKFYEFSLKHQDITNLPKFNNVSKFNVGDTEYTLINMERLYPIKNNSFEEAMVWILSDLATQKLNWNKAFDIIKNEQTWEDYPGNIDSEKILRYIDNLDQRDIAEYGVLFTVMTLLYHTGKINRMGWDLHTENVMQRKDGTLVIIDPWFSITDGL